ncbi:ATP-dependent helicase [Couchioplanes caeruleus]|uniref:ATP-dependent helicase n=1 Tax=Couchioplanes caeruleus TaxID=56438 RepID=UPI0020C166FD|nr:ATP-dependent DNA helicase [Couchioplanes caeruleus]UQU65877.1 ATP-dependent helicase [Couchioplanes caeruleus]
MTSTPAAVRRPAYRLVRRPAPAAAPLLDDAVQRYVAGHTDGPLLVVGGPGTGKTTVLVEAVAERIAAGVDPERILVLTFGRRGATALRDRVEARIGGATYHEPLVRTFHAYAFGLLRRAAAERGEPSPRLLTGPEQDLIIRELLEVVGDDQAPDTVRWPEALRPALPTRAFAQQLRDLMQRAAERGIGPVELARLGESLGRDDWPAAARFLREYVAVLALRDVTTRGSTAYDPAELIRAAAGLLTDDPALLEAERRRLAYVYVDELADTDPAQIDLLSLVAGGGKPLVAFGDPDSSIYGFRGADPEVIDTFPARFRTASGALAEVITLHTNYRARPGLLDATSRVARRMRGRVRHRPMHPPPAPSPPASSQAAPSASAAPASAAHAPAAPTSAAHAPGAPASAAVAPAVPAGSSSAALAGSSSAAPASPAEAGAPAQPPRPSPSPSPDRSAPEAVVRTFRSPTSETAFVAHALREAHLLHGVPWSRMAVVLRSTSLQLPSLQRGLAAAGVPTVTHAEDMPLHLQPAVAPFLLLLRCALDPAVLDEEAAVALLHSPLGGADPLAERRLRQGLRALALAAGDRRPSGELLVDAVRDPAGLDMVERRWATPAQNVARLLATAREAAAAPAATAEQVLWSVWRASGLAEKWYALSTRGAPTEPGGEGGRARQWRAEAADRDLDAMVVLFDAAARFVDRLPGARTEVFLDHVLGQDLPADSIAPSADRGEAVRLLTAHAAKGLEWDVVVLAGVQEGIWPDLRLRGSLLGSERLVDVLAGRAAPDTAAIAGQTSALLDEERRLFYVATTRARQRLVVTAVASASVGGADGEEQPSRFLSELAMPDRRGGGDPPPPEQGDPGPTEPGPDDPGPPEPEPDDDPGAREPDPTDVREPDPTGAREPEPGETGEGDFELPMGRPPRALTLSALVAELRTVVVAPDATPARRHAAAAELARLAQAGVPGAHPDEWWGLRPLSDDRPLVDEGEPVKVTPSAMESALRCSLRWLLERHGGAAPAGPAQGVGNLVHAAAMLAEDANADRERLVEYVSARFDAIELAARWLAGPEQERAQGMVDKLLRWLARNPRRLLAIEHEFTVRLDDPKRPIQLTGRVDRLEVDEQGRLVVIDLKTGKSTAVTAGEVEEHAQLAGYQAAVDAGAFDALAEGAGSGGAALVQLGPSKEAREQMQVPLAEADDPQWAYAMVRRTADTMAAATFSAVANAKCRVCPVRTSCPVSGQGRQVVEPGPPAADQRG